MRILTNGNVVVSEVIILDRELTDKEISLFSSYKTKEMDIVPLNGEAYSKIKRDKSGLIKDTIDYGYDYGGLLISQDNVVANTLYHASVDNKLTLVIATVSKFWYNGTSIPDATMKEFTIKYLRE